MSWVSHLSLRLPDDSLEMIGCEVDSGVGEQPDSEARSATLPLPPAVRDLIADGMELGAANDRVFATLNSKQGGGAYGLLTDDRYTRGGIYTQTLVIALIPFVNALYPQANR